MENPNYSFHLSNTGLQGVYLKSDMECLVYNSPIGGPVGDRMYGRISVLIHYGSAHFQKKLVRNSKSSYMEGGNGEPGTVKFLEDVWRTAPLTLMAMS